MSDSDKVNSYSGARDIVQKEHDEVKDPEKFRRIMKVDESGESEKRDKRRQPKKQEEVERETPAAEQEAPAATTEFSEVLHDKERESSPLDAAPSKGSAVTKKTAHTTTNARPYQPSSARGMEKKAYGATQDQAFEQAPPAQTQEESSRPERSVSEQQPTRAAPQEPESTQQKEQSPVEETPPQGQKTKEKETSSPQAKQSESTDSREKKAAKHAKKGEAPHLLAPEKKVKESFKERKLREKFEKLEKESVTQGKETKKTPAKQASPKTATKKPQRKTPATPEQTASKTTAPREKPALQKAPPHKSSKKPARPVSKKSAPHSQEAEKPSREMAEDTQSRIRDKKRNEDMLDEVAQTQKPLVENMHLPPPEQAQRPESKLPPHIHELFEKTVGLITVQRLNGETKTTVRIDNKHSIFHGAEIVLSRSDNNQASFNVALHGSPEAVTLYNQNAADLAAAFQKRDLPFQVNVQRASISKRYAVQKKGGTGGGKAGK